MDGKEIVRKGYNTIASEYLEIRGREGGKDVQLLQELVKCLPGGSKVLDVGCGAGVPVTRFLSEYFDVTGVDFSGSQLALARELVPEATFIQQDMTELDLPDETYDAITSYYAIIHVPRRFHKDLLLNFHRMLKPSGLILLNMGRGDQDDVINEDYHGARMYWSHFNAETNIELIKDCGFNIIWHRLIEDETDPGAIGLFVLAEK